MLLILLFLLCFLSISVFVKVVEVKSDGAVSTRKINRRQLLKSSGELNQLIIIELVFYLVPLFIHVIMLCFFHLK